VTVKNSGLAGVRRENKCGHKSLRKGLVGARTLFTAKQQIKIVFLNRNLDKICFKVP